MNPADINNILELILVTYADEVPAQLRKVAFECIVCEERVKIGSYVVTKDVYESCRAFCIKGNKIFAIKGLRQATGAPLRESKKAIEKEFGV
jgi:ribosomal protein L7/L12